MKPLTNEEKLDVIFKTLQVNGMILTVPGENVAITRNRIYPIETRLNAMGGLFQGNKFSMTDSLKMKADGVKEWLHSYLLTAYRRGETSNPLRWEELADEIWDEIQKLLPRTYVGIDPAAKEGDYSAIVKFDETGKIIIEREA